MFQAKLAILDFLGSDLLPASAVVGHFIAATSDVKHKYCHFLSYPSILNDIQSISIIPINVSSLMDPNNTSLLLLFVTVWLFDDKAIISLYLIKSKKIQSCSLHIAKSFDHPIYFEGACLFALFMNVLEVYCNWDCWFLFFSSKSSKLIELPSFVSFISALQTKENLAWENLQGIIVHQHQYNCMTSFLRREIRIDIGKSPLYLYIYEQ